MKYMIKKRCCWDRMVLALIIFVVALIVFRQYIFGGYYFVSKTNLSDLLRANVPTYYNLYDSICAGGNMWSWRMGLGTSMFSHADVYFDPFTYILFIFGREHIMRMLIWSYICKLVCEGITMHYYLSFWDFDKKALFTASLLYPFCGYSLIMGSNFALGTVLVFLPLVFLGFEKIIQEKKRRLLYVSLALTCLYSYYFYYQIMILLFLYATVRLIMLKKLRIFELFEIVVAEFWALLFSAPVLFPQIKLALESPRTEHKEFAMELFIPSIKQMLVCFLRNFSCMFLGEGVKDNLYIGSLYDGAIDYFQGLAYFSSIWFILLIQYFLIRKAKRREFVFLIIGLCLLISIPVFSLALNAFSTTSLRWFYFIEVLQAVFFCCAIDAIIKNGGANLYAMFYSMLISIVIIFVAFYRLSIVCNNFNFSECYKVSCMGILTVAIVYFSFLIISMIVYSTNHIIIKRISMVLFTGVFVFETFCNYYAKYGVDNNIYTYNEKSGACYSDASELVVQEIKKEDVSLYRIEKSFDSVLVGGKAKLPSENDSMAQGYFGLKCYNSLNNANYIRFLQSLGVYVTTPNSVKYYVENSIRPDKVTGQELNYINGVGDNVYLLSYLGVKYYISHDGDTVPAEDLKEFELYYEKENLQIYKNDNCLPIAFVNYSTMSHSDFEQYSDEDKVKLLFTTSIIDDSNNMIIDSANSIVNDIELTNQIEEKQNSFLLKEFSEDDFSFDISAEEQGVLNLSVPYDSDWRIFIDGIEVDTQQVNEGLLGCFIEKGTHSVRVQYFAKEMIIGAVFSFASIILLIINWHFGLLDFIGAIENKKNRKDFEKSEK